VSSDRDWQTISSAPDGVEVETAIIDERGQQNTQNVTRSGSLWFGAGMTIYFYYTPTHWRVVSHG
jgi:hypothetical protein